MVSAFGLIWHNLRYGGSFKSYLKEVKSREYYTKEQWEVYQTALLRKLLVHAMEHVPFYRTKYKTAGISIQELRDFTLQDLRNLPFLEKEELRQFGTSTLLSEKKGRGIFTSSSGSTGTPVKIFLPSNFHQYWYALTESRMRNWAGLTYKTPRGMIGGRRIVPSAELTPPFYRYNPVEKQTYFSAYHITPETAANYVEGIIRHKVEYMTGYAVSNYMLARFIEEQNLAVPAMKAVITSSEKLTTEMRTTLERVYRCPVFDSYSGSEFCGLISESPERKLLFSPDSGIMELISNNGSYTKPGETGEIVATGLYNFDQPLIRYRIGDVVTLSADQSPVGGRHMPVIVEISGRIEDAVIGKDGRAMVRFHSLYVEIPGLKAAQLIQHSYERFTIRLLIEKNRFNIIEAEHTIIKRLISQLGEVKVQFEYPDSLPLTKNGKLKAVISEIKSLI
ncbi:MAG TPA: hypothetical protein PK904_19150 [Bacteroidales bacterium]|nr:hypothetical protein [Bacteroidales bacterium]